MADSWMLDELAHAGAEHLDEGFVTGYDRKQGHPDFSADVVGRWLDGAAENPADGYTREDFAEHLRTEFSAFRWLLEPMLAATGFDVVTSDFRGSVYGAYTCVRR